MAWIERAPSGPWRARWREPGGRARSRSFRRKADAERFLATVEADKVRGRYIDPSAGQVRLREWVEQWWPTTVHLRPSSRARSEVSLRTRILPRFGGHPLAAIHPTDVRAFVAELSAGGAAAGTVRKDYNVLRSIMAAAEESGLIGRSPCIGVDLPPVHPREPRFLDAEELQRLAEGIDGRYSALVLAGGYLGLRFGELAGLKRHRVRLLERKVDIVETVVEVSGRLVVGPPKTGQRTVTIPRFLVDVVAEHMARHPDPEGYVFPAPGGGPLRRTGFTRRYFTPAAVRAGLEGITPHGLRHTAAALAIAAGAHPKEIQARLGHASITTTLNVYGHLFPAADERLADALDATREASARSRAPYLPPDGPPEPIPLRAQGSKSGS